MLIIPVASMTRQSQCHLCPDCDLK